MNVAICIKIWRRRRKWIWGIKERKRREEKRSIRKRTWQGGESMARPVLFIDGGKAKLWHVKDQVWGRGFCWIRLIISWEGTWGKVTSLVRLFFHGILFWIMGFWFIDLFSQANKCCSLLSNHQIEATNSTNWSPFHIVQSAGTARGFKETHI